MQLNGSKLFRVNVYHHIFGMCFFSFGGPKGEKLHLGTKGKNPLGVQSKGSFISFDPPKEVFSLWSPKVFLFLFKNFWVPKQWYFVVKIVLI
jgi:hypothetical protein